MSLQLGHGVHRRSLSPDNFPSEHVFEVDVTVRIDFYSGQALIAHMKLDGDLISFEARGKSFRCNLWNVAVRVNSEYPHTFFLYEMDHDKALSEDGVMIILFSCNDVRNQALAVLRRTGALLLDENNESLFGPRPGTARIDAHNPLGDFLRKNASLPDMRVIWEEFEALQDDEDI